MTVPVDVFRDRDRDRDRDLELVDPCPGTVGADQFGLEQGIQRLSHRVVIAVVAGATSPMALDRRA